MRSGYAAGDDELHHSNLLFFASHNPAMDAESLFAEHCRYGASVEEPLRAAWPHHANGREPERRLKVGIVSGDLREHAVATFIEPLLAQLGCDPSLEMHAYYNHVAEDAVSRRLRTHFRGWRPVSSMSDGQLAAAIMQDRIDILLDLSGHTALNRLPVFARKPAPIQASWFAYPGTTGLRSMDYHLADRHLLPPGEFDRYFTEKLVYLPGNAPFQPHASSPPVTGLPASESRILTFASFNRPDKISDASIRIWSRLLRELPQSRMLLGGIPFEFQHARFAAQFAAQGIAPERLAFHPPRNMGDYLALHGQVDICLDTCPYSGGTTTLHALSMGVPTITLSGSTPPARSGAAILLPLGLDRFVAADAGEFVELGRYWAGHIEELAQLRAGLRERLQQSPGRQPGVIAAALQCALRRMWRRWCDGLPAESFAVEVPHDAADGGERELLALVQQGNMADGAAAARRLTARFPERGLGWKVLGALLSAQGEHDAALSALQTAVLLLPQDAEAFANLGLTLATMQRFDESESALQQALAIDPGWPAAHYRLGMSYVLQGRFTAAEASLRRGIALSTTRPSGDDDLSYSHLLFLASHNAALGADELFAEHCRYGERLERPLKGHWPRHPNQRDPDRRLKVGFVSGDLYNHAVASFLEPVLLRLRDDPALELHAYYGNDRNDEVTQRLRGCFEHWSDTVGLPDEGLAQRIMAEPIDILIDLSGHTGQNRLPVFARKPAPIQASWIGYPGTSGLEAMDYYLAGRHFLPPGEFDRHFTEKLVCLPANVPFQPHAGAPPVSGLPALATGRVTLGSFNRLGKINDATVALWSQCLRALPDARLLIAGIPPGSRYTALIEQFSACGIAPQRLALHGRTGMEAYLALHQQVDLCLDTTPYTGGTTTSHALWMGVPTLTLAGPTPASRSGAAFLGDLGLFDFIARDAADFAAKGLYWATHLTELAAVRAGLRARCAASPATGGLIGAALKYALRRMWRRWCEGLPAESFDIAASRFSQP
jgi:predicted O-linked N-acetylglucosamine transferase (SPINDLY family)